MRKLKRYNYFVDSFVGYENNEITREEFIRITNINLILMFISGFLIGGIIILIFVK